MKFDLALALIDCDDNPNAPWYRAAAKLMIASARRAYRGHDMRIVQLTDEASEAAEDIDIRFNPSAKVERDELMQYRGHCIAEWALETDRPVIFCDVDLLWNTDALTGCLYTPNVPSHAQSVPDIILTYRKNLLQPFNGGLIMTQPGQKRFWETYRDMMKSLPLDIRGWWGDQIALAVMLGAPDDGKMAQIKFGSTIAYLPAEIVSPSPPEMPKALLENPSVHFKGGKRKTWLTEYFEMLMSDCTQPQAVVS